MIGRYLTVADCCKSVTAIRKGIENIPDEEAVSNMNQLAINVYDKLVDHFGFKIPFSSWFRSIKLNRAIGGSRSSDHCLGCAVDIDMDGSEQATSNAVIFMWIMQNLEFNQLIWEFGDNSNPAWVHVSYRKGSNRKQVLKAAKVGGKTVYTKYESL